MRSRIGLLASATLLLNLCLAAPLRAVVITAPVSGMSIPGGAASAVGAVHALQSGLTGLQMQPGLLTPSLTPVLLAPALQAAPAVLPDAPMLAPGLDAAAPALAPIAELTSPAAAAETDPAQGPQVTTQQSLEKLAVSVSKGDDKDIPCFYDQQAAVHTADAPASAAAPQTVSIQISEGIPTGWVKGQIKASQQADPATVALQKKAQTKGFRKTALNKQLLAAHNNTYTDELPVGRVTDQQSSGRCWIFAGLNMIRDMLVAKGKVPKGFEFSENYLYFYSQLERANTHLEKVIRGLYVQGGAGAPLKAFGKLSPEVGDGGGMDYLQFLISKYGLVPKSAMPETRSSNNTSLLDEDLDYAIGRTMQELQADARSLVTGRGGGNVMAIKQAGMERVWKILSAHLGLPPTSFDYGTKAARKSYTPKQFATRFARFDPHDYVVAAALPHLRQGVAYEEPGSGLGAAAIKKDAYNWRYLNVDVDRLEELVVKSIQKGKPVYFRAPVGRDIDPRTGIMHPQVYDREALYGIADASQRLSRAKEADLGLERGGHLMVFTGFDRPDAAKPVVKYKVENSWGPKAGDNGVFHMYREWFRQYVTYITVPRSLLAPSERKVWDRKAKPEPD
jgi:bleomycin hydrolase